MSIFGWSYPPGCSGPPEEDDGYPSWHDELYVLLENNDIDEDRIDQILKICMDREYEKIEKENSYYERCYIMDQIITEVRAEQERQAELWGTEFDDKNTANDWCAYICNYVAAGAYDGRTEQYSPEKFREHLKKAACLCIAAIEAIDRNGDCAPRHYENKPNAGASVNK